MTAFPTSRSGTFDDVVSMLAEQFSFAGAPWAGHRGVQTITPSSSGIREAVTAASRSHARLSARLEKPAVCVCQRVRTGRHAHGVLLKLTRRIPLHGRDDLSRPQGSTYDHTNAVANLEKLTTTFEQGLVATVHHVLIFGRDDVLDSSSTQLPSSGGRGMSC